MARFVRPGTSASVIGAAAGSQTQRYAAAGKAGVSVREKHSCADSDCDRPSRHRRQSGCGGSSGDGDSRAARVVTPDAGHLSYLETPDVFSSIAFLKHAPLGYSSPNCR